MRFENKVSGFVAGGTNGDNLSEVDGDQHTGPLNCQTDVTDNGAKQHVSIYGTIAAVTPSQVSASARHEVKGMPKRRTATREEWETARSKLREREQELARLSEKLTKERRQVPWVPVEKEYSLDTDAGPKTLVELFDGRSQLLVYHLMFGPGVDGWVSCLFNVRRPL
jgi:Bacterial protein of unknown function (DUF899)